MGEKALEWKNMKNLLMKKYWKNLDEAVAFEPNFNNMIHAYDDMCLYDFNEIPCNLCRTRIQVKDLMVPKSNIKKDYGILSNFRFGVSDKIKNLLIEKFDISEDDFRPVRTKANEIVFYQIAPQHTMLPIANVNSWKALKPCKKCGSVEYEETLMQNEYDQVYYYINKEALQEMHDINITYEKFGLGYPIVVVSRRVFDFLVELYPRMTFSPFFLKE